jgi:hypothetical protein
MSKVFLKKGAHTLEWNKAAYGPAFEGTTQDELGSHPWAWRTGRIMDVTLPFYSDAAGHVRLPYSDDDTDTGELSLYRDGKLVGTALNPVRGTFTVPMDDAAYRLTAAVKRNQPWWPLATGMNATWTFNSRFSQGGTSALPLLTARFDPKLDLRNTAPGGRMFSFGATVHRPDAAPSVVAFAVKVSYDDGKTWQPATVTRDGTRWKVTVTHPAAGYVSLRAEAKDADGNTVDQTVLRAYQLR